MRNRADLPFWIFSKAERQRRDWLRFPLHCDSQSVLEALDQGGGLSCRHEGSYKTQRWREEEKEEQEEEELLVLRVVKGLEQMSSSRMAGKPATASRASSCVI